MKLDRVTITGADDSVAPGQLLELSRRYPFVEWGILVSKNSMGTPRFPSSSWLQVMAADLAGQGVQLSMHLCGSWLRNMLLGVIPPLSPIAPVFQRMQLNFHGERQTTGVGFEEALAAMRIPEIIFQIDGNMGQEIIAHVEGNGPQAFRCVPLFDLSHGAGVLPADWPKPFDADTYHGYAGGLGPDNLEEQIQKIAEAAGEARFWIDMETKVRSDDGRTFDLAKVERCLEIASRFIKVDVMADCARLRAAQKARPMTIEDAIDKVRWLERTPDGILDPAVAKRVMATLLAALERSRCYYNATLRGQEVFVLVEQDRAAPLAIETWAAQARTHGCAPEKVESAFAQATRWATAPRVRTKWPT